VLSKEDTMDVTKFRPVGSNVLLRIIKRENKTAGGLFLSEAHSTPLGTALKCRVEAVGPGELKPNGTREEILLVVGDTVLLGKLGPVTIGRKRVVDTLLDADWENLIVVSANEILAVLETVKES
jgi:chaperonin GroES